MLTFHNHNLFSLKAMDEEVNIYPCGVVISPWSPWLAATPDRKVFCPSLDPPHGLLEIKCPVNSLADCVYLSKDENGYHLKETHKYFHQIMTQLGVTGLKWCNFLCVHLRSHVWNCSVLMLTSGRK